MKSLANANDFRIVIIAPPKIVIPGRNIAIYIGMWLQL